MPSTAQPTLRDKNTFNRIDGILKNIAMNTVEGETPHAGQFDEMEQLKKIKMLSYGTNAANQQFTESKTQKKQLWKYCHKKNSLSRTNSNLKGLFSQSISNDVSAGDLLSVAEKNSMIYQKKNSVDPRVVSTRGQNVTAYGFPTVYSSNMDPN